MLFDMAPFKPVTAIDIAMLVLVTVSIFVTDTVPNAVRLNSAGEQQSGRHRDNNYAEISGNRFHR